MKTLPAAIIVALCAAPGANAFMPLLRPLLTPKLIMKSNTAIFSSTSDYFASMSSPPPEEQPNGGNPPSSSGGEGDPMVRIVHC